MATERRQAEAAPADATDTKQRTLAAVGLNRHEGGLGWRLALLDDGGQLLDRRRPKQCAQRQFSSERLLDSREQTRRDERVAANLEEVGIDADRLDLKEVCPDRGEHPLGRGSS